MPRTPDPADLGTPAPAGATGTGTPSARPPSPLGWLRGVAALTVVFFHAYQHQRTAPGWEWPWSGPAHQAMVGTDLFVDMFFVLSGLVLWLPVAQAAVDGLAARRGRVLLLRRMARLLPLYVTVVVLVWALTNPSLPGHWQDLVLHLTFTHVYSDQYIFWTNGPAWSLAVEFHFYVAIALAVPFVNAAVRRSRSRRGRIAAVAALPVLFLVVSGAFLTWATVLTEQSVTNWSLWYGPLSRAGDFGIGMLLAVMAAAGLRLGRAARGSLAVAGVVGTGVLVMTRPFTDVGEWWHPAYALTIAVAMSSVVLHDGPWPRVLSWRPLAWVGGLGYGVYLIHEPVMRLLGHWGVLPEPRLGSWFVITFALVAVPSLLLAWVSSKTVEAAGLRLLATMERDGTPRDYYAHLRPAADDLPRGPRPQPA